MRLENSDNLVADDCQWICTKDGHKMVDRLKQQLYIEL